MMPAVILPFLEQDLRKVQALQPPNWEDIIPHLTFYLKSPFCEIFKIEEAQEPIAIGSLVRHEDTAWVAHIIVHPDYRKQGLGALMTEYLVQRLQKTSIATIYLIATDLGYTVYEKIGFRTETTYVGFKGQKLPTPSTSTQLLNFKPSYEEDILRFDRLVSGENRAAYLQAYLPQARLYVKKEKLEGVYFPNLGDGLIIASNEEAGKALVLERLSERDFAVIPEDNQIAIALIEAQNFAYYRSLKRMRLGKERPWQPQSLYNRIGGKVG